MNALAGVPYEYCWACHTEEQEYDAPVLQNVCDGTHAVLSWLSEM